MVNWTAVGPPALASFMAAMVEFVEALTIVLAVGVVRGWRSALLGSGAALGVLVALIAILGPSLMLIPLPHVQLVVGSLLLLFGLRWLRKAVLRAAGVLPLHDEAQAFIEEKAWLGRQLPTTRQAIDKVAFATAFKIVMLEGIEVVFIVIAIGSSGHMMVPASIGAGVALLLVMALGLCLHRPLAQVPENTLKFGVGVMLSAFGAFWVGEGIGISWPGADWAALALILVLLTWALALVRICSHVLGTSKAKAKAQSALPSAAQGMLAVVGSQLLGLFIDDGWLATGVIVWIAVSWGAHATLGLSAISAAALFTVGLGAVLTASAVRRAKA